MFCTWKEFVTTHVRIIENNDEKTVNQIKTFSSSKRYEFKHENGTFSRMQTAQTLAFDNFLASTGIPQKRNLVVLSVCTPTLVITIAYN